MRRSYTLTGSQTQYPFCPDGAMCTLRHERIWTLLSEDANGIFVLERLNSLFNGIGTPMIRVKRYRRPQA